MKRIKSKRAARLWKKEKKRKLRISFKRNRSIGAAKKRKPISRRAVLVSCVFLMISVIIYAALFSQAVRIKKITVTGAENIIVGDLESLARNEMAGKKYDLIPGDNYFFQDADSLETKIEEAFAEIEGVNVSMRFPDEIVLELREKNTALIWCRNMCYFVNDKGVAFLLADEGGLIKEQKHFIKIIEEADIAEESEEERQEILEEAEGGDGNSTEVEPAAKGADMSVADIEAELQEGMSVLPAIIVNEKVADESFIRFAMEIGDLVGRNSKIRLKYFKTKGYKTRELIGFTDQNTRLYFDTTKSAEKQAKNLDYLLSNAIEKENIDALRYIYLKNEDRVFYK